MDKNFKIYALSILGVTCLAFLIITAYANDIIPNDGILPLGEQELGATITTINATDTIKNSRAVINTNFSNLNTDKIELTDLTDANIPDNLTITNTPGYITDGNTGWTNIYGLISSSTYFGTTTLPSSIATTTSRNGIDISSGCFAIDGTCVAGGAGSGTVNSGTAGQFPFYATDGTALTATSVLYLEMPPLSEVGTLFVQTGDRGGLGSDAIFYPGGDTSGGKITLSGGGIMNIGDPYGGARIDIEGGSYEDGTIYGGNLVLVSGSATSTGEGSNAGYIKLTTDDYYAYLYTNSLTDSRTFGFPNLSGTFAVIDARGRLTLDNITANLTGTASTSQALLNNPSDCGAGAVATAIDASGNLTCSITPLISGGTLTSANVCQYDGTGIDCNLTTDGSGACASGAVCLGDHTHSYDNYSSWTIQDGDSTTYTVTSADTLQIAEGTGIDSDFTGDDVLTISVKDDYLKNTGDIGTGVYDFGGALSFEIPNGTSARLNAAGDIKVGTNGQLVFKDNAAATSTLIYQKPICYTASTSAALTTGTTTLGVLPFGFTVYRQSGKTLQGTSIKLRLHDGTNWMTQYTATATRAQFTPAANNTWTAGEEILLSWSNVSGAVWGFNYCAYIAPIGD